MIIILYRVLSGLNVFFWGGGGGGNEGDMPPLERLAESLLLHFYYT